MIKLIHGDCIEVMKKLDPEIIDLTVTSPPYDNLRTYNDSLDWGEHVWKPVIEQLFRITKKGGVVVWVIGDATIKGSETGTSFKQALYFKEVGFNLHDTMIYQTHKPPMNDKRYQACFEYMFIFSKSTPRVFNAIKIPSKKAGVKRKSITHYNTDGSLKPMNKGGEVAKEKVKESIWTYASGNNGDDRVKHPARFPEQLANDHIISWSNQNDLVFDPFLGSGTTGKMAILNNRSFIGIEKDPEYFKIAQDRINAPNS